MMTRDGIPLTVDQVTGRANVLFHPYRRKHDPVPRGYASKLESHYAQHLETLKYIGEIVDFWYEPVKLRLADSTFYTPDFLVEVEHRVLEFRECKGWMRDDANVKLKVAAALVPWARFVLVRREKGQWVENGIPG